MTDGASASLIRRRLGRRVAELRTRAGLSQQQAGEQLELGRTTIGRIEDGDPRVRLKDIYIRGMIGLYGVAPAEAANLLAAAAATRNSSKARPWWHAYADPDLPEWFAQYLTLEDAAEQIRQYEAELVPGLLQTRRYAEVVMGTLTGYLSEDDIRRRVAIRMERQTLLTRPRSPHLDVVLNESVLHRPVGAADVMAEQLRHLLDVAQRTSVSVRILPWSAGAHAGMAACGPFTLMNFPTDPSTGEPMEPALVYVDTLTGAVYHQDPAEIAAHRVVWEDIARRVLDVPASRTLLTNALKELV